MGSLKKVAIKDMDTDDTDTKMLYKEVYTVSDILDFNEQYQQGLSRLPISLAQLKAGNNSEKLKKKKKNKTTILFPV